MSAPYRKGDIEALEKVHKRATKGKNNFRSSLAFWRQHLQSHIPCFSQQNKASATITNEKHYTRENETAFAHNYAVYYNVVTTDYHKIFCSNINSVFTAAKLLLTRNMGQCPTWWPALAALPNIGGALCSTPQSLADAHYYSAVQ